MANSIVTEVVEDGVRNFVVKVTGILDTSDQPMTTIVKPSDCAQFVPKKFRIDHIDFTISDQLEIQLYWDAPTPTLILPMAGRNKFNYPDVGGLQNTAYMPTGAINLLTSGYVNGTQVFSMLLWLVKQGGV